MKIIISTILLLFGLNLVAQNGDFDQKYLAEFDRNVVLTINVLTIFNDAVNGILIDLDGLGVYQKFLLEMTLECSSLRKIADSNADSDEIIKELILHLKPNAKMSKVIEPDRVRERLANYTELFEKQIFQLRKKIILEEKMILESKTFTKQFLDLHAKHFLYSLLLDFLKPAPYLSHENSALLLFTIQDIGKSMLLNSERLDKK